MTRSTEHSDTLTPAEVAPGRAGTRPRFRLRFRLRLSGPTRTANANHQEAFPCQ